MKKRDWDLWLTARRADARTAKLSAEDLRKYRECCGDVFRIKSWISGRIQHFGSFGQTTHLQFNTGLPFNRMLRRHAMQFDDFRTSKRLPPERELEGKYEFWETLIAFEGEVSESKRRLITRPMPIAFYVPLKGNVGPEARGHDPGIGTWDIVIGAEWLSQFEVQTAPSSTPPPPMIKLRPLDEKFRGYIDGTENLGE